VKPKPDWWIISQVAARMGFADAFAYTSPADIFREHARLSAYENDGARDFDIGAFTTVSDDDYAQIDSFQRPCPAAGAAQRLFTDGRFYTPSEKARFVPIEPRAPANAPDDDYPLVLNTGRIRDQWHTMTRTGRTPRLTTHIAEPFIQIHPVDAAAQRLGDSEIAEIRSRWGRVLARIKVDPDQRPGSVFAPMHWSEVLARSSRVDALVNPALDPVSEQPEFKHTPVHIRRYQAAWYGFVMSIDRIARIDSGYCVAVRGNGIWRTELAGDEPIQDWWAWARAGHNDRLRSPTAMGQRLQ
jgi:assimilatory nitrate reductase catalytic subunit